jgi:hypothetical protein
MRARYRRVSDGREFSVYLLIVGAATTNIPSEYPIHGSSRQKLEIYAMDIFSCGFAEQQSMASYGPVTEPQDKIR